MTMKKLVLATIVASSLTGVCAQAGDSSVAFNLGVTSDYRYRGPSQTDNGAALQGGVDYSNSSSGFYVGAWGSTITWIDDAGGDGKVEVDIYAGKKGNLTDDFTYDFGVLTYVYPSNNLDPSANTTEIYGQLGYGPAYIKYSHALTNLFGVDDSKGSGYLDVGANVELAKTWTLNLHAGHQSVSGAGNSDLSYTDYLVGVTKDFGVVVGSLAVIGTDIDPDSDVTKAGLVLTIKKNF